MAKNIETMIKRYSGIEKWVEYLRATNDPELINNNIEVALIIDDLNMGYDFVVIALLRDVACDELSEEMLENKQQLENLSDLEIDNVVDNTYEDYRNVLVIMAKDYRVIILELANRVVMMRNYKKLDIINKRQYAMESLNIYAPIAHRLGLGQIKTELEELSLYFIDIDSFKQIVTVLDRKKSERDLALDSMVSEITNIVNDNSSKYEVFGRSKSIYSIYNKTIKKDKPIESIFDLQGIRIICDSKQECYLLLGLIHEKYTPVTGRFKDYIALKKPNLYQSLHTAVKNDAGEIFEIQIRTFEMDEIAERGIAAHWTYKEGGNHNQNDIEEQLHLFRDLIGTQESEADFGEQIFESSIYTFTPNKKIIHLPKNANVIDFAYRIHTKVAEQMVGAIVNGKIQAFDIPLENGDTVEILTKKGASSPNQEWLDLAQTTHAKRKIKTYLKKQSEQADFEYIVRGEEMFEAYLRKLPIEPNYMQYEKNQKAISAHFSCQRVSAFYKQVATKEISFREIELFFKPKEKEIKLVNSDQSLNQESIVIKGADGIKKLVASCCRPIPGDEIVGVIQTGQGIKVHRTECPNAQSGNIIDADWNEDAGLKDKYEVDLMGFFEDRDNLVADILTVFNKQSLGLKHIDSKVHGDIVKTKITTIVYNYEQLASLTGSIESVPGCVEIKRLIK